NPLTGKPLELPESQTERALMASRFPKWYTWLEENEKSPISQIVKLNDERQRVAMRRGFFESYDHSKNIFANGSTHTAQAALAKSDALLAEWLQGEAKAPADFGFENWSTLGKITKHSPSAGAVIQSAREIQKRWATLDADERKAKADEVIRAAREFGLTI